MKKSNLKGRQQSSSSLALSLESDNDEFSNDDITFNQSLLDKLASGEAVIDDSGENTIIRLVLDHDEFTAMIDAQSSNQNDEDEENVFSADGTYVDKKEREERKKSLAYSVLRMKAAEAFIHRDIKSGDRIVKQFDKEKFLADNSGSEPDEYYSVDGIREEFPQTTHADEEKGMSLQNDGSVRRKSLLGKQIKKAGPRHYLTDMSKEVIFENVYGTAVIGLALAASILLFDFISISTVRVLNLLLKLVVENIPFIKSRRDVWRKSAKPLVLLSVILFNAFFYYVNEVRNKRRFADIGYKEGEKILKKPEKIVKKTPVKKVTKRPDKKIMKKIMKKIKSLKVKTKLRRFIQFLWTGE